MLNSQKLAQTKKKKKAKKSTGASERFFDRGVSAF
jgi:hypothetical protein